MKNTCNFHKWETISHYGEVLVQQCTRCNKEREITITKLIEKRQKIREIRDLYPSDLEND